MNIFNKVASWWPSIHVFRSSADCGTREINKSASSDDQSFKEVEEATSQKERKFCDLGINHVMGGQLLVSDPLKRTVTLENRQTRVMWICHSCYGKALAKKAVQEGRVCDFDATHVIRRSGLSSDPLKRLIMLNKEQKRIMRLCQPCYRKALAKKALQKDAFCNPGITYSLSPDSLKNQIIVKSDGQKTTRIMRLRQGCHGKAMKGTKHLRAVLEDREKTTSKIKPCNTDFSIDDDISITKHARSVHQIDHALPILQDPQNYFHSLLLQEEGPIDQIVCVRGDSFVRKLKERQLNKIIQEMREWLTLNEFQRDRYKTKLDELFTISTPNTGPQRGFSVYAKRKISKFEVVAPYAGILLKNQASLNEAIKANGSYNVFTYLFGTGPRRRHNIDAFATGNVASLVNTSQLGNQPAWGENNLSAVVFGKNLIFYVAMKDIQLGEELLVNYGPNYDPTQQYLEVKEEPL